MTTSQDADEIEYNRQTERNADSEHDSDNDDEDQFLITSEALTDSTMDPAWIPYVEFIREHNTCTETRVQAMYLMNEMFTRFSTKIYCLVPLYKWQTKYIPIDTTILYDLLVQSRGTEKNIDAFSEHQVEFWQTHFKLPPSLLNRPLENGKKFRHFITTDGVGASVLTGRWRWVMRRAETTTQKKLRIAQIRQAALD